MAAGYARCLLRGPNTLRGRSGCGIHASAGAIRRRWRFALAARYRAVDGATTRQKGASQQRAAAGVAREALVGGMPVLPVMAHLSLIHANGLAAVVAVLGEHCIEAEQAVGLPLAHNVPLPAQLLIALVAGEVIHVPGTSLGLGALVRQDNLKQSRVEAVGMLDGISLSRSLFLDSPRRRRSSAA